MGDMLSDGVASLASELFTAGGTAATYRRGGLEEALTVVVAGGMAVVDMGGGAALEVREVDFIVKAADFPFTLPPAIGDVVRIGDVTYQVKERSGAGHWRWCDGYHVMLRLFAEQIVDVAMET